MLEYDSNGVSEDIDTKKKTDGLRECIICQQWYFVKVNFRFQPKLCNGCHDTTKRSISFDDFSVITVGRNYYRILFLFMTKEKAKSIMNNSDLKKINNVMESNTQEGMSWVKIAVKRKKEKNKERFKQYYQDNKEGLQGMVHD